MCAIYGDSKDALWDELEGIATFRQPGCDVIKGTGNIYRYEGFCFYPSAMETVKQKYVKTKYRTGGIVLKFVSNFNYN